MKIEQKTTNVEEIMKFAKDNGISDSKLEKAANATFLPKEGRFVSWAIEGEKEAEINGKKVDTRHLRVYTASGDSISVSSLQGGGFDGEVVKQLGIDVKESQKSGFYLIRNKTVNPELQGNQATIVAKLIGKSFTAEPIDLKVSTFVEGGCKSIEDMEVKTKTFYKVTLK